jgi:HlyD family secretion protein
LLLLAIGLLTWFVKYPETVSIKATLTGTHTPKAIIPHTTGRIIKLFKSNNDKLTNGDIIGCMETVADWQEVLICSKNIDALCEQVNMGNEDTIALLMQENYTRLGELQSAYQSFRQAYISYQALALSGYAARKKSLLQKDNALISQTQNTIHKQNDLYKRDLSINQSNLEKNKKLLEARVISQAEYDKMASENISKQIILPQAQSNILTSETQKNNISKELLEIDNQSATQGALFREAAFSFRNAVDEWKNKYFLIASISGTLSFTEFIQENQQLEAGKIIAYINPDNSNYYLKTVIPQQNFGKVVEGQKVILKFPAYQWQEYGTVTGKIDYVSPNTNDSGNYIATIILPKGLATNYDKQIIFREGLKADAEIITKDMRLAQRFYYDIIKQVRK